MINNMTRAVAAALLGAYALPAAAVPAVAVASRPSVGTTDTGLVRLAQARERREFRQERRDVQEERRELRRAQRSGDRGDIREERRDVRRARRDLRDTRRDLQDARADRRFYVRDGRRFYRGPNGAEIFAGFVAGALAAGAAAATQQNDAIAYCESRFRSYDRASGTYLGYDGRRHPCP